MPTINRPLHKRTHKTDRGSDGADLSRDIAHDYRRMTGAYIRNARLDAGLTQAQLGEQMGLGFTAISAIESGRNSVPPERYEILADILGLDHMEFAKLMLRYSNPWVYKLLFGQDMTPKEKKKLRDDLADLPTAAGASGAVVHAKH